MIISKTDSYLRIEQKQNNRDFISSVLDEIFLICKEDKHFSRIRSKINGIGETVNNIQMKVVKQDELLNQSKRIRDDVTKKVSILDNENFKMKVELLEKLGSSIWI